MPKSAIEPSLFDLAESGAASWELPAEPVAATEPGPKVKELRSYQLDVAKRTRDQVRRGVRRVILQAETGAGKTVIASHIIRLAYAKGSSVLFIARGRELVNQASATLWDFGVPHGIIMRGEEKLATRIQVASKDSLQAWTKKGKLRLPEADLVVVDECHNSVAPGWRDLLNYYRDRGSVVLGLTATPARMDGRSLGDLYEEIVCAVPPSQLIREGWVVRTVVFAPYRPNLKGVRKTAGDYSSKELEQRLNRSELVGDALANWEKLGEGRPTLVYTVTRAHSLHVAEQFRRRGIKVAHVDGETPARERDDLLASFNDGRLQVLCNVGVLKEGVDLPRASCGILLRPTLSYVFYRQMTGRLKRPYPGKEYCLLLDHAGAVYRHGLPDLDVEWTLEQTKNINKEVEKRVHEARPIECKKCSCVFQGQQFCPNCGEKVGRIAEPKKPRIKDGRLTEVAGGETLEVAKKEEQARFWRKCLGTMAHRGGTIRQARMMYFSRWKEFPHAGCKPTPRMDQDDRKVYEVWSGFLGGKKK